MSKDTFFIISGPSGVGKTSLLSAVLPRIDEAALSISHTTRPARRKEVDGKDYYFIDDATFTNLQKKDYFLETADIFGYRYGTHCTFIEQQCAQGKTVILEIDFQGAAQVREKMPCTTIMILPPSTEVLLKRLQNRNQDSGDDVSQRLAKAKEELSHYRTFDFVIANRDFDVACQQLKQVLSGHPPDESNAIEAKAILKTFGFS